MDDLNIKNSCLNRKVKNALNSALQGDSTHYEELVDLIHHSQRSNPVKAAMLATCLKTISSAVASIDIVQHRSLLEGIFSMCLWKFNTCVMDALLELIISLASFSAVPLDLCLEMMVSNFVPPAYLLEYLNRPHYVERKKKVFDRVHASLETIFDLVPLSALSLERIVRERMPSVYHREPIILMYVENMLRLESGTMGKLVRNSMLMAIMVRLIDLDVEIPWDVILHDDFVKGDFGANSMAEKLDSLMVVTLEHIKLSSESGRLPLVFETLLQSFKSTVLTAYKSKFAQFVIFYACSLDPENCGQQFAITLLEIFLGNPYLQCRMSAVAYLASYLSRAMFVSDSLVVYMLERLVYWCIEYCKNRDGVSSSNPRAHQMFYAGCQAFMYILCFRFRSLILVPRFKSKLALLRVGEILKHPLNPLKVCLPSIVEEFLRVVRSSGVFAVPENSPASSGLVESELSRAFGGSERLDMFFPFDPYLLKKSGSLISPIFVYWSMVVSPYHEQEDDDEKDSSDEDEADVSVGGDRMMSFDDDDFEVDDDYSD
ncbi:OLC1v1018571C1 [Oldenlandia corymbosa var. corymbosa]|uniref:OLC1v1018571C1 n=1 Tax=Oldenlandia corymbosa var. corymbosa TaxID=529605 RepID=A0AAV1EBY4_OLDCO|nr:OLC1v1018571C1 [Oldenlandia corymbosa var. corymbosa]